jgi:hypothetical protein
MIFGPPVLSAVERVTLHTTEQVPGHECECNTREG